MTHFSGCGCSRCQSGVGVGLALGAVSVLAALGLASRSLPRGTRCCRCGSRAEGDFLRGPMRRRRLERPYSIGVPVAQAAQTWPLVGFEGEPGLVDQLPVPRLVFTRQQPRLELPEPIYGQTLGGVSVWSSGAPVFTRASKMDAPSFGLPAGPPPLGGTCVAARLVPGKGVVTDEGVFVCRVCYAAKGEYVHHGPAMTQAIRLRWVVALLERDPTGALFADRMIEALDHFARISTVKSRKNRKQLEFGVWEGPDRIMVPAKGGPIDAERSALPAPWESTRQAIAALGPSDGQVAGYFRLHDSGDLNVGGRAELWLGYIRGWTKVARAFPAVLFWLPTRAFFVREVAEALRVAARVAPNLVVRPSAFTTAERPPVVSGLAAGTTVLEWKHGDPMPRVADREGREAWPCPVYVKGVKSCLAAGCRMCWVGDDVPVWYKLH